MCHHRYIWAGSVLLYVLVLNQMLQEFQIFGWPENISYERKEEENFHREQANNNHHHHNI